MKKYLSQTIDYLRKGERELATEAFSQYCSEKSTTILSETVVESEDKDDNPRRRNFVAKNMNKVNRSSKHRDKKNDYRRKEKHKNKMFESESKRKVKVTYDDGSEITTSMAANLSDKQIKDHFKVGKEFNLGSGGKDKMAKVENVTILEDFDANKAVIHIYNKTPKHYGYVSQGIDKEDVFRRAKKVVDAITKSEGIIMSVEDKHVTARNIADKER